MDINAWTFFVIFVFSLSAHFANQRQLLILLVYWTRGSKTLEIYPAGTFQPATADYWGRACTTRKRTFFNPLYLVVPCVQGSPCKVSTGESGSIINYCAVEIGKNYEATTVLITVTWDSNNVNVFVWTRNPSQRVLCGIASIESRSTKYWAVSPVPMYQLLNNVQSS